MSTNIEIKTEYQDLNYFSEDNTIGVGRVGRGITLLVTASNPLSGVKKVLSDSTTIKTSDRDRGNEKTPAENQDITILKKTRQGVEVRSAFDLDSDFLPFISVGNKSPYPVHYKQKLVPSFDEDFYGVFDKINRDTYIPFDDINKFNPVTRLSITNIDANKMYPVFTGSHYKSEFTMQAVLEPLEIRKRNSSRRMIDTLTHVSDRGFFTGVRGKLMGGGFEESERGTSIIKDTTIINDKITNAGEKVITSYDDTRHKNRLTTTHLPINFKESPGTVSISPFTDTSEITKLLPKNSYGFMTDNQVNTLYEKSIQSLNTLGNVHVSSTAGFVYDSTTLGNTTLGTDSIAFGGLKRG